MTTPSININLTQCKSPAHGHPFHGAYCFANPILIPCPIPRSVTLEIQLEHEPAVCSACDGSGEGQYDGTRCRLCRGRGTEVRREDDINSIRVSCSISGKTWEESWVSDVEVRGIPGRAVQFIGPCGERWGFIKSLMLGHSLTDCPEPIHNMRAQRDAVFSALADMARAEETIETAQQSFFGALHGHGKTIVRIARPSHSLMETYVEHLIEQVGMLR